MNNKIKFEDIKDLLVNALKEIAGVLPKGDYDLVDGFSWINIGSLGVMPIVCLIEKNTGLIYQFSLNKILPNIDASLLSIESGDIDAQG
jgi:hypothetical protein